MVAPTRHKNADIDLYECVTESFTDVSGNQTDFIVVNTPLKDTVADTNNKPYHRVYANGVKVVPTSVTGTTKTYVITPTGIANSIIEITYPKTAKARLRIQQGIEYSTEAKTDEWEELGSSIATQELISRRGSGNLKLLKSDKTEISLLEGYADTDTPCLLAIKDNKSALAKTEYTILPIVKFLGIDSSINVGGKWEQTFKFAFKAPVESMAIT